MAFTRGIHTLTVPMRLFGENRQRLCQSLKKTLNETDGTFVFLQGGRELMRYNTDATDAPFHQASSTIFNEIGAQTKKQKLELVSSGNAHLVPSLALLWDYLSSANITACRSCGFVLAGLVKANVVDGEFALQQLLNLAKVAKCPSILLSTVGRILVFLSKEKEEEGAFASIHLHPLVQFCRSQSATIEHVLTCADHVSSVVGFNVVLPPMTYLALAPDCDIYDKNALFTWFCNHIENADVGVEHLWTIYEFVPLKYGRKLIDLLLKSPVLSKIIAEKLAVAISQDISSAGACALSFLEKTALTMSSDLLKMVSIRFSSVMLQLPYELWGLALNITEHVCKRLCPLYCNLFFVPLINLNSILNQMKLIEKNDTDQFQSITSRIQSCLAEINSKTREQHLCSSDQGGTEKTLLDVLCQFPKTVLPYLQTVIHLAYPPDERTLNMLSSILILYQNNVEIVRTCCEAMVKMVAGEPNRVSSVLPVFVQVASRELASKGGGETVALEFLPKLAVHHLCTPTILRFFIGLASGQRARNHGYRLLGDLYEKRPFIYDQIKEYFQDVDTVDNDQLLLLKMKLVFTVCKGSAGDRGDELASILTRLINKRVSSVTPATMESLALAIRSVGELCRFEALDPDIAWKMLYGKFNKSKGSVLSALCDLAGTIAESASEEDCSTAVNSAIFQFIWKLASSSGAETECRTAALRALSKFDFSKVDKRFLRIEASKVDEASDSAAGLPGDLVMSIFEAVEDESLEAFGLLLSKLISAEIETLGRGVYYNAKSVASRDLAWSSNLDEFCSALVTTYSNGAFGVNKNIAAAVLMIYEPVAELHHRGGGLAERSLISAGRQYLHILGQLLKAVPYDDGDVRNWKRTFAIPFAWIKFIGRLYSSLIASRKADLEAGGRLADRLELESAHMWARDKVAETLKTSWREDTDGRPNCCLALAALCLAVKNYMVTNTRSSNASNSNNSYVDNRYWIIMVVETLLRYGLKNYSPMLPDRLLESLESTVSSSLRIVSLTGLSLLLPHVRQDIGSFYDGRYGDLGFLLFSTPSAHDLPASSESTLYLYTELAKGIHCGESFRQGVTSTVTKLPLSEISRITTIGGWLGASVYAIFADDSLFAETLLTALMDASESGGTSDTDRSAICDIMGLVTLTLFPDYVQWIDSESFARFNALFSQNDEEVRPNCTMPGFLRKFIGPHMKLEYQRYVSARVIKLTDENVPFSEKVDAFCWLASCCGSDYFPLVYIGKRRNFDANDRMILNELCKFAKSILKLKEDDGQQELKSRCLLQLAGVAFAMRFAKEESTYDALPTDYSYLPESSVLRHCIGYLLRGRGNETRIRCILHALTSSHHDAKRLPPLDWDDVIGALSSEIRDNSDRWIVKLAIKERSVAILANLTHPTTLHKLSETAKLALLESLDTLAACLSPTYLKRTLNAILSFCKRGKGTEPLLHATLRGLKSALRSASSPDVNRSISVVNTLALSNFCVDLSQFIYVNSYNDFRLPLVQHFINAATELESVGSDELTRLTSSNNSLLAFSVSISSLIRHSADKLIDPAVALDKTVEAYSEVPAMLRPSGIRIMCHEFAFSSYSDNEREDAMLHLMNVILLLCVRTDDESNAQKAVTTFEVFMVCVAAWCHGSLPVYLLKETNANDELKPDHDAEIVNSMFANVEVRFADFIFGSKQSRLSKKSIEWAFQLLPMARRFGKVQLRFVLGILRNCRATEYYESKLAESGNVEKLINHAFNIV